MGQRIFEVDMQLTSDGHLVCWHDWGYGEWGGEAPTKEEFLSTPIEGVYTALSIDDLLLLMQTYDDICIVTDTKDTQSDKVTEEFEDLVASAEELDTADVLDRFVVQIYNDEMMAAVRNVYDFDNIIYTLYQIWDGEADTFEHYAAFCAENGINHITMWYYLASSTVIDLAQEYGIHILVHTVNDLDEALELIDAGVENIYTDDITPEELGISSAP